ALLVLVLGLAAMNFERVAANGVLIGLVGTAAVAFGCVLFVAACLSSRRLRQARLYDRVLRMMPLHAYVERAAAAAHAFGGRKRMVLAAASLSFVGHIGTALMFVLIGRVVLPALPVLLTALLALMGMVANALPITPGGLGVGEAAFDQLFGVLGVTGAAALLIVWRLGLVPFATLGALAYITGAGRSVSASAPTPSTASSLLPDGPLAERPLDS
ncbi:MAG: lysylphosphatidylglycerol synthase domain-containing protein, partial [Longimicrobiales bacterium]